MLFLLLYPILLECLKNMLTFNFPGFEQLPRHCKRPGLVFYSSNKASLPFLPDHYNEDHRSYSFSCFFYPFSTEHKWQYDQIFFFCQLSTFPNNENIFLSNLTVQIYNINRNAKEGRNKTTLCEDKSLDIWLKYLQVSHFIYCNEVHLHHSLRFPVIRGSQVGNYCFGSIGL